MKKEIMEIVSYIEKLVRKGGPEESEYEELNSKFGGLQQMVKLGAISQEELDRIRNALGDAISLNTMQGFSLGKPHGYAGDFEIIDRIYRQWLSEHPSLVRWDRFFHWQPATKAVRNRKSYFHQLLTRMSARHKPLHVLKLGVGPGRSMFEWLESNPNVQVHFECVELDYKAISFAQQLNALHLDRVSFCQQNALVFRPRKKYHLIWIAGLFDYFDDRVFVKVAKRMLPAIADGGELVIGNFSLENPSRAYMETLDAWVLRHRAPETLVQLLEKSGAHPSTITIRAEPEGVNLFAHVNEAHETQ